MVYVVGTYENVRLHAMKYKFNIFLYWIFSVLLSFIHNLVRINKDEPWKIALILKKDSKKKELRDFVMQGSLSHKRG